jgi:hypothetical protein
MLCGSLDIPGSTLADIHGEAFHQGAFHPEASHQGAVHTIQMVEADMTLPAAADTTQLVVQDIHGEDTLQAVAALDIDSTWADSDQAVDNSTYQDAASVVVDIALP